MKPLPILTALLLALAAQGHAAEDPIAVRQALMNSNGNSAAVAGGVMKGEIAYSAAVSKSVITSVAGVAQAFGDYFPEGSIDDARSDASPKIWEDMAGFQAELADFRTVTASAVEAAGREGPADLAAFQVAMKPIFDSCTSCHETYRTKR